MFFKYTCLGNADGQLAKLLVVVAVPNMPEDAFFVREVPGLAQTTETSGGFLLFVKKRAGNAQLNQWFHKGYLIPEIARIDQFNDALGHSSLKSTIYIDGESSILNAAMQPHVLSLYRQNNINGVKSVPSGTSAHQAWDVSPSFMNIRRGVNSVTKKGDEVHKERLRIGLGQYYQEFKANFPSVPLTEAFKRKLTHGCEVLAHVFDSKAVTANHIQDAFVETGQHTRSTPTFQMAGQSLPTTFVRLPGDVPPSWMMGNWRLWKRPCGNLSMIAWCMGICKLDNHESRDNLVLYRQSPRIFTHHEQEHKFTIWQQGRSPEEIQGKKALAEVRKLIEKEVEAQEKAAAKKRKREEDALRKTSLTPQQRRAEKKAIDVAKKQRRDYDNAEKVRRLAAAHHLVNNNANASDIMDDDGDEDDDGGEFEGEEFQESDDEDDIDVQ